MTPSGLVALSDAAAGASPADAPAGEIELSVAAGSTPMTPVLTPVHTVSQVQLRVMIAWEGRDLRPHNLEAVNAFRTRFQDLPVTHLISPAYFTKPGADQQAVREALRQAMRPGDQVGLLLGNWRSLAAAAGVIFRSSPTFWGSELKSEDCAIDCGLEVPVNIYPAAELDKLFRTSLAILSAQGFGQMQVAAVEGWVASTEVLEAAYRAGLRYDMSAVAPELLSAKARYYPLYRWVKGQWPQVTPHTQPYSLDVAGGKMTELPQALASFDYLNQGDVFTIFKEYAERLPQSGDSGLTFPLVVYQESAFETLPLLGSSLQDVFAYAQSHALALTLQATPEFPLPAAATMPLAH